MQFHFRQKWSRVLFLTFYFVLLFASTMGCFLLLYSPGQFLNFVTYDVLRWILLFVCLYINIYECHLCFANIIVQVFVLKFSTVVFHMFRNRYFMFLEFVLFCFSGFSKYIKIYIITFKYIPLSVRESSFSTNQLFY